MTDCEIVVAGFLDDLQSKDVLFETLILQLTKTQRYEAQFVARTTIHPNLSGVCMLLKEAKVVSVKEKYSTAPFIKDVTIKVLIEKTKFTYSIRLVKESDVRKPSEDGVWGINITSFKSLKK